MDNYKKIQCDFHIHTPSSTCYKGKREDEKEYMNILYTAIEKKLDVICITDHNTLHGYFKIIDIINKIKVEYDVLTKYNTSSDQYIKMADNLEKLKKLEIIPGIELTVNPGYHILLLFDKNKKKEEIIKFFDDINMNVLEIANENYMLTIDINYMLELAKDFGCITIAPHVDSNKGIFNSLDGFKAIRAKIFKSEFLDAVTCNNEIVKKQIVELTNNDDKYKRVLPLAFVKGSDAHNLNQIGEERTYIDIVDESLDIFLSIKSAILHPTQSISTIENFETESKINSIIKNNRYLCVENFNIDEVCKTMCAILNSYYGNILIGVSKNERRKGILLSEREIVEKIKECSKLVGIDFDSQFLQIDILQFKDNKYIILLSLSNIYKTLYCYNNQTYFTKYNDKTYYQPTPKEIENYVKNKIFNEIKIIEKKNDEVVKSILKNINMISKSYYYLKIKDKLQNNGKILLDYIDRVYTIEKNTKSLNQITNGESKGYYYYTDNYNIRLEDSVLRYTCPVTNLNIGENDSFMYDSGEYLVIKKNGASHYINSDTNFYYYTANEDDIIFKVKKYNPKLLIGWMKSSLFVYTLYSYMKPDYIMINNMIPFSIMPDFSLFDQEHLDEIVAVVDKIINEEQDFLFKTSKIVVGTTDEDKAKYNEMCINHNNKVNDLTKQIDGILYHILHISTKEKNYISEVLRHYQIFDLYNNCIDNAKEIVD